MNFKSPVQWLHFLLSFTAALSYVSPDIALARQGVNPVQEENVRPGTTGWQLTNPATHGEIEGFASLTSVNRGETIHLYVSTDEPEYTIDVYRLGWYQGAGGRLIVGGIRRKGFRQSDPILDPETGLVECRWNDGYKLTTSNPTQADDWRSGVFLAKLTAHPSGKDAYIIFVVREDDRPSAYLFQSSVTTFQAYNNWGGKSLYSFNSSAERPARKVSFNRPYASAVHPLAASGTGAGDFLTASSVPTDGAISPGGWEVNMLRWLEREGYDVTYSTNIDTHSDRDLLFSHKVWLSVGHDEYWTRQMRLQVEEARMRGVNLTFFSANTCYWQIRLEPSSIADQRDRVIVAYKDAALQEDPLEIDGEAANDRLVTVRWRDDPVLQSEDQFMGVMFFDGGGPVDGDIVIRDAAHWATSGIGLHAGDRLPGLLGYEVDGTSNKTPVDCHVLAHSAVITDGSLFADMVLCTMPIGGSVFSVGSLQWSWALDDYNVPLVRTSRINMSAQQLTRNVLAQFAGDQLPVPHIVATVPTATNEYVMFDASRSVDNDGTIVDSRWDFGDGTAASGTAVGHRYRSDGPFRVQLTVRDEAGAAQATETTISLSTLQSAP